MSIEAVVVEAPEVWAHRIRAGMAKTVDAIIETGQSLMDCKEELGHGNGWPEAVSLAGLGMRTAERLMAISGSAQIRHNASHLPPSWATLYELTRITPEALDAAISDGVVRPDMTRAQVKHLVPKNPRPPLEAVTWNPNPEAALYSAIVIDPPWQYGNTSTRGAAEDHYGTMTIAELAEMELPALPDSHLYLWVTNNFMREGFELLDAWGFTQKTILTWVKPQMGMGNYFRSFTEHVLFATRGSLPTLRNDCPNWFQSDRQRHSQKPDCFYDLVESSSPGPYMEMFARRRRFGWASWGNEV